MSAFLGAPRASGRDSLRWRRDERPHEGPSARLFGATVAPPPPPPPTSSGRWSESSGSSQMRPANKRTSSAASSSSPQLSHNPTHRMAASRAPPTSRRRFLTRQHHRGQRATTNDDYLSDMKGDTTIERTRSSSAWKWASRRQRGALLVLPLLLAALCALLSAGPAQASMCQYSQQALQAGGLHVAPQGQSLQRQLHPNLVVCPKASQFNDVPAQFQSINSKPLATAAFERQQRAILKSLNASFTQHMQPNGHQPTTPAASMASGHELLASDLIDDELLNEIVSPLVLDETYERAKELIVKRRKLETELIKQGFVTDMSKPTAVARHQRVTTTTTRGNELEKSQEVFDEMSRILSQNLTNTLNMRMLATGATSGAHLTPRAQLGLVSQLGNGRAGERQRLFESQAAPHDELETAASEQLLERSDTNQLLARIDLHQSEARHAAARCEEDQLIQCDPNFPYRHADGRCNNLQKPTWGKANTCFARLLPADYSDGQGAPRVSVTGHPLPNPRILSAIVHRDFNYPATYTHFVMQYGQFFAHDIAFTPSSRTKSGSMIQCCPIERDSHPQCFPILVPPDDPFYSNWEESCLNFVRTAICPRCRLGPREQMNQITSFIDGSQVYGSAANETAALWTKSGPAGRMHVSLDDAGRELLPHSADPSNDQCSDIEKGQFCYRAGDRRVNQHPALTAVHTIWLRQHNRIVNALKMINAHWNGDRLYQEAKRIATAQMQMVTYNEWLSLIIGQEAMKFLKLNVLPSGYTKYDPTVDPSLLNEFSGAAFRFGHSMINNIFAEILPDGRPSGYRLNEFFFHPFGLKAGQHDMVMRGLISQASQNRDPFVSSDIKNHLYRPRDNPYGLDLPAFNIQRGRDHGIPGYTKLVEFCFDDAITNWKQLDQYMPVSQRIRFSKLYRSVHDLDLFSAGLAEYPLPGAALGPTFTCIVGIQMFNLKYGDRFWFEHGGQVGSFTPDQLQEIRKANLARLICANSDDISVIQKNVFRGESPTNPSAPCNSLPDTDLRAWKEEPGTRSVFSDASEQMGKSDEYQPTEGANGANQAMMEQNTRKKKKRSSARPKQEPLAYAFRSAVRHHQPQAQEQRPSQQAFLGSEYGMPPNQARAQQGAQMGISAPAYAANKEQEAHNNAYGRGQSGARNEPADNRANANHFQAVVERGQVLVKMSNTYNAPPRGGRDSWPAPGDTNTRRPPFGMPVARRAPSSGYQGGRRLQQERAVSSMAPTYEQLMRYGQPVG